MINLLKEIVHLESPSTDKKAVDRCSDFIIREFKKSRTKVIHYAQKTVGNLHAIHYPASKSKEKKKQILVLTHVDTVWPVGKIQNMPFYLSGDKIYGPGVLDMKAGVVMAIYALKTLHDLNIEPDKNIVVFINSAEEIGNEAAYEVIQSLSRKSAYVLCLEPSLPGGSLKIQRKGRMVVRLDIFGKSAHAGTPENGINAIEELMFQLKGLIKMRKAGGTTLNIGLISGGEKPNIVAEKASATLDIRFWTNTHRKKIIDTLKQLNSFFDGAKVRYVIESKTPPMEKTPASLDFLAQIREIAESSLGISLEAGKTGGGSDASIASNLGIPTIDGLGPDGDGIHSENEHLILSSLVQRTALLTELLHQL